MATGKEHVAITTKRVIGTTDLGERFLDYLKDQVCEMNSRNYSAAGWLGYGANISADGTDRIQVTKANSESMACDGVGHFLDVNPTYVYNDELYFENASGVDYYVHVKYASVPTDVQVNPVYGQPEYISWQDQIGKVAQPNSVTDNGGTITFNVTNVTESGVSNEGRKCLVWMNNPASGAINKSIAIEECTVQYNGGINEITTSDVLGQATVDTSPTEYKVALLGPTINRYVGATIAEHAYVGIVTGVGAGSAPTAFDISGQIVFTQSWIDIFADGLGQNFFPKIDNTYDLGTSSKNWKDGYFAGVLYVDSIELTGEITGDIIPSVDNAYDVGSASNEWKDGYFDGTLNVDVLSPSAAAGEGVVGDLVPTVNNSYDLGNGSYQWANLILDGSASIDGLILSSSAGDGSANHLVPDTDSSYDLGNSSYQWRELWIDLTAHIDTLDLSVAAGEGCDGSFVPTADGSHDLGTSSYEWQDVLVDGTVHTDSFSLHGTTITDFIPFSSASRDLGSATNYWDNLYADNVYYKTTLTTFDTYDDLKLIEEYKPTNEIMKIEKDGKTYDVNRGDASTIPWPMKGALDPDEGNHFLDLSDSTMFLLGAIKQLYQLHKKDVLWLKDRLDGLTTQSMVTE